MERAALLLALALAALPAAAQDPDSVRARPRDGFEGGLEYGVGWHEAIQGRIGAHLGYGRGPFYVAARLAFERSEVYSPYFIAEEGPGGERQCRDERTGLLISNRRCGLTEYVLAPEAGLRVEGTWLSFGGGGGYRPGGGGPYGTVDFPGIGLFPGVGLPDVGLRFRLEVGPRRGVGTVGVLVGF